MTSFAAAIAALRTGRVRPDGIISHKFALDDYGRALASEPTAPKVVIDIRSWEFAGVSAGDVPAGTWLATRQPESSSKMIL
jgi:hypothetical protein